MKPRLLLFIIFLGAFVLWWYSSKEAAPQIAKTVRVTIPEGFNVYQVASALENAEIFSREDFLAAAQNDEGFLFPDTYEFFKQSSTEAVIRKMRDNFEKKTAFLSDMVKNKDKTMRDIVIMASILEEEVPSEKDRKLIAGILWKRLEEGMLLQVDAALTYVTGRASHKLTDEDLALDSPYNTYKYNRLPAGPISNPGLGAIEASLNPAPSAYWFYLSDSKGVIHYAKTFDEHKLNKIKYLR